MSINASDGDPFGAESWVARFVKTRPEKAALLVVLAFGFVSRLWLAWLPFESFQVPFGPMIDDSFYLFGIARNMALGLGPTHDLVVWTSGFQPLVTLLYVPIFWAFPHDAILPLHLILTMQAGISLGAGAMLYGLTARLAGRWGGVFAAMLWSLSPWVTIHVMTGMETGLAVGLMLGVAWWYVSAIRGGPAPGRWGAAGFGGLCALLYLARVDGILFLIAMSADYLWVHWRSGRLRQHALPVLGVAGLTFFTVTLPWHLYCQAVAGSFMPESGQAVRLLARLYNAGGYFNPYGYSGIAFYAHNLATIVWGLLWQPVHPLDLGYLFRRFRVGVGLHLLYLTTYAYAVAAATYWALMRRLRPATDAGDGRMPGFLILYGILLTGAYVFWCPAKWFYPRYMFPLVVLGIVFSGIVFEVLNRSFCGLVRKAVMVAVTLLALGCQWDQFRAGGVQIPSMGIQAYRDLARRIDASPELIEPIGVCQGGVVAYLSHRRIVTLDGKVNRLSRQALAERKVFTWLASCGVHHVLDADDWVVKLLLANCSEGERRPEVRIGSLDRECPMQRVYIIGQPDKRIGKRVM